MLINVGSLEKKKKTHRWEFTDEFDIVISTEKAVICKSFVLYVYNLFVYVLTAYGCKTRKMLYTNIVYWSVSTVHLAETL